MRDVFESQLKTLKDDMIEMGSMIEKAIENAIRALNNRDTELARAAIEADRRSCGRYFRNNDLPC